MFVHVKQMHLFKLYKKELIFHKNELYWNHRQGNKPELEFMKRRSIKMIAGLGIFVAAYFAGMVCMTVKGMA